MAVIRAMFPCLLILLLGSGAPPSVGAGYVTFGNGWGSKWDDPVHGAPATITWGFMPDGTLVDPSFGIAAEINGGSNITSLRNGYDAQYGAGMFDQAIQHAMATWEAAANVRFLGPIDDPNPTMPLAVGAMGATTPDIRIGAFMPVSGAGFDFVGAVGFGPPGDDLHFPDPLAGDILFNLAATFIRPAGAEDAPIAEFGNDLENLVLHELGHAAIGLGHPEEGVGDVMYVGPSCCDVINRQLSADDIAGAQVVYGPPPGPGDVNFDGVVDIFDVAVVSAHWGETGPTGDANRDMMVDIFDVALISANWSSSATAVPEPATVSLIACAAATALAGRKLRRRPVATSVP